MLVSPPASTATVPLCTLAAWAAPSMPRASPETTMTPCSPSPRARSPAKRNPTPDALRAPTMAQAARSVMSSGPSVVITGGGGSRAASPAGKSGSHAHNRRAPIRSSQSCSASASSREAGISALARPPLRASSGSASSAASAVPKRFISSWKVTGPTPRVRASLSQAVRPAGLSSVRFTLSSLRCVAPVREPGARYYPCAATRAGRRGTAPAAPHPVSRRPAPAPAPWQRLSAR